MTTAATVAESAWQLQQKLAHEAYLGYDADPEKLRRDLIGLALLVYELAEELREP